jgi:hypothetical protein
MDGARAARRSDGARRGATASARSRRCPRCERKAALSEAVVWEGEGRARKCRYCGHEVGVVYGKTFGYDVTPEPGVRGCLTPRDSGRSGSARHREPRVQAIDKALERARGVLRKGDTDAG